MGATSDPKIQVTKQEAHGSSWNANSFHYEEKDYSSWGKKRLNELLDKVETKPGLPITHSGQDFALELKTELKKLEGDAWVNIRKGKKMTCFNYEVDLAFKGHIVGGESNRWDLEGKFFYEVAVDDDEPETRFEFKQRYPFQREVEKALVKFVTEKFKVFVSELSAKGSAQPKAGFAAKTETRVQVGQYQKYEQGPDGVAALQETAKKYSDKMNSEARQEDKPAKHLHCEHLTH
ncbi:activator of Hsp90 ATPase [Chloropicon roscoffensis]|uniref:Activator of Hsp90 ATPase n=1 Tax=Chloropicon roscoffensis TaxID=1461544 RepID=A0A7S3CAB2_9CHLO|mmetsp:Transcript_2624/g.7978  ORF Transcript_2624/g.7978 Transcript_2624/m.7978 type:complete len:234 (+) Transcript_2624:149-850(+)